MPRFYISTYYGSDLILMYVWHFTCMICYSIGWHISCGKNIVVQHLWIYLKAFSCGLKFRMVYGSSGKNDSSWVNQPLKTFYWFFFLTVKGHWLMKIMLLVPLTFWNFTTKFPFIFLTYLHSITCQEIFISCNYLLAQMNPSNSITYFLNLPSFQT